MFNRDAPTSYNVYEDAGTRLGRRDVRSNNLYAYRGRIQSVKRVEPNKRNDNVAHRGIYVSRVRL